MWGVLGSTFIIFFMMFALTQILALKCVKALEWTRIPKVDDSFLATFCSIWNLMMIILIIFSRLWLGEFVTNPFYSLHHSELHMTVYF